MSILVKTISRSRGVRLTWGVAFALLLTLSAVQHLAAQVRGPCSRCHVMHNSQNDSAEAVAGIGTGWDNDSKLSGGPDSAARETLLVSNCIGCHSSLTDESLIAIGETRIPIVYNLTMPPAKMLAGGNFYWVANGNDTKGHNVHGISGNDSLLPYAPGDPSGGCFGSNNSCHDSLALADEDTYGDGAYKNGCQACHASVLHHGNDTPGTPLTGGGGWYRFLSTPSNHFSGGGVAGIEAADWEQDADNDSHNSYYASSTNSDSTFPQTISKFCAGCHYQFHSPGHALEMGGIDNGGGAAAWLRHPNDAVITNDSTKEYRKYTTYNPLAPVGRPDLTSFTADTVRPGTDLVICISCHRAHGSPYPDMLRWDYDTCIAGTPNADCGCFVCHSTKDGVW